MAHDIINTFPRGQLFSTQSFVTPICLSSLSCQVKKIYIIGGDKT